MKTAIIDASAAVRIFVPAAETPAILAVTQSYRLVSPWLILAEAANALWKYTRSGHMAVEEAQRALASLPKLTEIVTDDVSSRALMMARHLDHAVYDCFYLALAEQIIAPLLTADRRLAKLAEDLGIAVIRLDSIETDAQ